MNEDRQIQETFQDFRQEVVGAATANNNFQLSEFILAFARELEELGECETVTPVYHEARGFRVDGFAINGDEGVDLFIADTSDRSELETLTTSDARKLITRLTAYYRKCTQEMLFSELEETSEQYHLARLLYDRRSDFGRIRFFVLSERALSAQFKSIDVANDAGEQPITLHVWDISRIHRIRTSRNQKEPIEIDFQDICGRLVPCLPADVGRSEYSSYLLAIPGDVLADLYKRFGSRLMEQNVRAFLQATNASNRGIRDTILNEPSMFFAYNNGITATAASAEVVEMNGVPHLRSISDLQIVNGGQTTASLFHARRKDKARLDQIFVQMKLTIIAEDRVATVVPRISQYANTQSRINAADFFSNHPFHIRVEEFSRRVWAPPMEGSQTETHWFYERTRGQYREQQAQRSTGDKRLFLQQFPKAQLITKTDLAKYENCWEDHPRYVHLGAQKNFAQFARRIGADWDKHAEQIDELWFRRMICRAIMFRTLEKIVSAQPWYSGGYRANIVAYTLSLLAEVTRSDQHVVDLDQIWKSQALDFELSERLAKIACIANAELSREDRKVQNVTEWAKRTECWEGMCDRLEEVLAILGTVEETIPVQRSSQIR